MHVDTFRKKVGTQATQSNLSRAGKCEIAITNHVLVCVERGGIVQN
jgi:hypothetical protein